jgi:hypothetical protein
VAYTAPCFKFIHTEQVERTQYEQGEKWWGPDEHANPNLTPQKPLLDGAEELLDRLPNFLRGQYARDFHVADEGFYAGRVAATTKGRESCWARWTAFCVPMGVDPFLQDTPFSDRVCMLKGFAGRVRTGYYGRGKQVQAGSVSSAITAVGQVIALATNTNPTKVVGSNKLLP